MKQRSNEVQKGPGFWESLVNNKTPTPPCFSEVWQIQGFKGDYAFDTERTGAPR